MQKFSYEITSGKCEYKGEVEAHDCRDAILRAFAHEFGDTDLSATAPFNSLLEWTGGHEGMSQFKELDKNEPGAMIHNDDSTFDVYVEPVEPPAWVGRTTPYPSEKLPNEDTEG